MTDKLKFDDLLEDLHNKQSKLAEIICGDFVKELCIKVASEISKEKLKEFEEHKARQIDENRKISKRIDELEKYVEDIKHTAIQVDFMLCEKVDALYDKLDQIDDDEDDAIWEIEMRDGRLKVVDKRK